MIEQDYILRVIQDFGKLMRTILNQKTPISEIEGEIDSIVNQWMGLPSRMLLSLPACEVFRMIKESERMVFEKNIVMAKLCQAKGLLMDAQADKEEYFNRAQYFYGKCLGFGGNQLKSEVEEQIYELKNMIKDSGIVVEPVAGGDAPR